MSDAKDVARAKAKVVVGGNLVTVSSNRQLVDVRGNDKLLSVDGSSITLPGEGRSLLEGAFGADSLLLMQGAQSAFTLPYRLTPAGVTSAIPLPAPGLGVWEAAVLPRGGIVMSVVEKVDGDYAEQVNLWALGNSGRWTRLTSFEPEDVSGMHFLVSIEDLRTTERGRVFATALRYATNGTNQEFESLQLIVDPKSVSSGITAPGEIAFDEDATGAVRLGLDQVASLRWIPAANASPLVESCDAAAPSEFMPDPDLISGP